MTTWRASIGQVPELRRLRYFLAVAGEQNFTRAAELLHVAQPALSRQVRLLEQELGVELLHRTTHTFELTEAGRFLCERGPALLDAADELWRLTSAYGSGERGAVALGYGASAGYETVPELMRALTARLPDLLITTHVMSADQILAGVLDGTIDIGAIRCPPADTGLETRLLRLEPQGVQLRRDDPQGRKREHLPRRRRGHALPHAPARREPGPLRRRARRDARPRPRADGGSSHGHARPRPHAARRRRGGRHRRRVVPARPPRRSRVAAARPAGRARDAPPGACGGAGPATERLLAAAEEVADELGWRDG